MNDTPTYRPIVEAILEALPDVKVPKGMDVGLKFTSPTQTTYNGFAWPDPGKWTVDFGDNWDPTPCAGGGVHAALTIAAAQSGGGRYTHAMLVCWRPTEATTSPDQADKVKARQIKSLARIDLPHLLRTGALSGAYLSGADLSGAYLTGANLTGANLYRADLSGAYLSGADLTRANLTGADLTRADLTRANLTRANLYRADLTGAYLTRADLTRANANERTRWPDGFDPHAAGVVVTA